jgi:hypothetical protein
MFYHNQYGLLAFFGSSATHLWINVFFGGMGEWGNGGSLKTYFSG